MSPILKILTVGGVSRPAAAVLRGSGRDSGHGQVMVMMMMMMLVMGVIVMMDGNIR